MNIVFLGMAGVLLLAAAYWARGRSGPRPTGTWAMCALLVSFALAFTSYSPVVSRTVDLLVPEVARPISNSFTLAAATSVLAFLFQLNLEPDDARRRIRLRLGLLGAAVAAMITLFVTEQLTHRSPQLYAVYVLIYVSYLGFTVKDFLQQTWTQSKSSRRTSQRIGLRMTALGCLFALLYAAYKIVVLLSLGLGLGLVPDHAKCSTLVTPAQCAFSVASPALAVLLIAVGLTLPAVVWPISQLMRRRWEARSYAALEPLWQEMASSTPEIVLASDSDADDPDFLLHRRVIEISDGILALRPYRSVAVQQTARRAVAAHVRADTPEGSAIVEAAVLLAAVRAKQSGWGTSLDQTTSTPGSASRAGSLRAETEWLLQVARAYTHSDIVRAAVHEQAPSEPV
ncbi:MAG TPA: hypothetical protein DEQ61_00650 [Streptomyces sp.]|nr:hypothetical protein [Streptomyces sp.]